MHQDVIDVRRTLTFREEVMAKVLSFAEIWGAKEVRAGMVVTVEVKEVVNIKHVDNRAWISLVPATPLRARPRANEAIGPDVNGFIEISCDDSKGNMGGTRPFSDNSTDSFAFTTDVATFSQGAFGKRGRICSFIWGQRTGFWAEPKLVGWYRQMRRTHLPLLCLVVLD